ncbi:hypothetical protein TTHERM_00227370 (macronuclear) [Tetrahymena thermophila SB210]|uniref:Uncharacterized protein n=1 Tax=Tetrahymena thermophila (strain SB210) TaxID=312017 RepID=Q23BU5_TETTS|nr:hypothetical protein TTHERM_00227370 [Tetrahymena thermophila SB210]EAR94023.1 hypothetical protein TTHERM_00227370 [Tetrahymena thermophila SB210]|eukprot:XP_001014268.1 hypothetical protein TTHERM_00227370 [Tetrahymena thermophila SB210]
MEIISSSDLEEEKEYYEKLIILLGLNDEFKLQNLRFLTRVREIQSSQSILKLNNQRQLISYPMKDDLDLKTKIILWNQINDLLKEKQLLFALILDEDKLFLSEEKELSDYLESQLLSLNYISDVNLFLQLKILTIIVSPIGVKQRNNMNEEMFNKQIKLLKEQICQIYWKKQPNIFRTFLYYLIQIFSAKGSYLRFQQQQPLTEQLLEELYSQQTVDSIEFIINPPDDVQDQMMKDCLEQIKQLKLEECNFDQFKNLFCQISSYKSNIKIQELYNEIIQTFQIPVLDLIEQLKINGGFLQQYNSLLEQIKTLEMFEQYLSSFNFTKIIKSDDYVQSIFDAFENQLQVLHINEMNDYLITLYEFSQWNKKFQLQEINLKQKIGSKLSQILKVFIDQSERELFSQNLNNLQEIIKILTNYQNIQEFLTGNLIMEIKEQLAEISKSCQEGLDKKYMILESNKFNFKNILTDLQYFLDLLKVQKVLSSEQFQKIFEKDIKDFECEQIVNNLKQKLEKIKSNIKNDFDLIINVLQEKESVKQIYQILNLEIKIDEQDLQQSLMRQVQRLEISLTNIISKKDFGKDFVDNLIQLEKCEILNNNLKITNKIQKEFKEYYSKYLEMHQNIDNDEIDYQTKQNFRQEQTKLDDLKKNVKFKTKPKFLVELFKINIPSKQTK